MAGEHAALEEDYPSTIITLKPVKMIKKNDCPSLCNMIFRCHMCILTRVICETICEKAIYIFTRVLKTILMKKNQNKTYHCT